MNETATYPSAKRNGVGVWGPGPHVFLLALTPRARAFLAAAWIEQCLACFAEAVERMPEAKFLVEHQAAHDAPRSASGDMVAAVLEREYWRRWPEGRDE